LNGLRPSSGAEPDAHNLLLDSDDEPSRIARRSGRACPSSSWRLCHGPRPAVSTLHLPPEAARHPPTKSILSTLVRAIESAKRHGQERPRSNPLGICWTEALLFAQSGVVPPIQIWNEHARRAPHARIGPAAYFFELFGPPVCRSQKAQVQTETIRAEWRFYAGWLNFRRPGLYALRRRVSQRGPLRSHVDANPPPLLLAKASGTRISPTLTWPGSLQKKTITGHAQRHCPGFAAFSGHPRRQTDGGRLNRTRTHPQGRSPNHKHRAASILC